MAIYLTSRDVPDGLLAAYGGSFEAIPWFNMWRSDLSPYEELAVGDTIYWYSRKQKKRDVRRAIVTHRECFPYKDKKEIIKRLNLNAIELAPKGYFDTHSEKGFCLAFRMKYVDDLIYIGPSAKPWVDGNGWKILKADLKAKA